MKNKVYILKGRYGLIHRLIHIGKNTFKIDLDDNASACFRCGGTNREDLEFVDPPGGPFIAKNTFLPEIKS